MKIYKLTVNELAAEPTHAVLSSYKTPRDEKNVEFYLSEEKAKQRQKEIYDGMTKLMGFFPRIEVVIKEIEVIE